MISNERRDEWTRVATRLCRRVNIGWWYQDLIVPLIILSLGAGAVVVASRRYEWEMGWYFWGGISVLALGLFAWAWSRSKGKRLDLQGAFVRLDVDLGLNNALSTAAAERGAWPPMDLAQPILSWRFGQLALPLFAALAFFSLGFVVPVAPVGVTVAANQPYSWSRLETEIADLAEKEVIQDEYVEEIKKRLEELRNQKAQEWFSAASLEATDSLQQAHSREATRLERDLLKMEKALRKEVDPRATEEQRQQAQQQFQEALEGMRGGQMKANEGLLKKLAEAAEKGMQNLPADQLEALKKKLREMADQLGGNPGQGDQPGPEGDPGEEPGQGDPQRGPGTFSQLYGDLSPDLKLKKFEHLDAQGSDDQAPGDLLKLEEIEHDVDRSQKDASTSGTAKSEGLGGDRVWKDALDPDEQKSLKSFFE